MGRASEGRSGRVAGEGEAKAAAGGQASAVPRQRVKAAERAAWEGSSRRGRAAMHACGRGLSAAAAQGAARGVRSASTGRGKHHPTATTTTGHRENDWRSRGTGGSQRVQGGGQGSRGRPKAAESTGGVRWPTRGKNVRATLRWLPHLNPGAMMLNMTMTELQRTVVRRGAAGVLVNDGGTMTVASGASDRGRSMARERGKEWERG